MSRREEGDRGAAELGTKARGRAEGGRQNINVEEESPETIVIQQK